MNSDLMKSWYKLPAHLIRDNEKCTQIRVYFYKDNIKDAYKHYMEMDLINEKYSFNHFSRMGKTDISELEKEIKKKNLDLEKIKNKGIYYEVIESKVKISNVIRKKT